MQGKPCVLCYTYKSFSSSTEYKSFGFPAYVRRCIDMLALMSHRWVVCRGNLVFCATHRNLSVHSTEYKSFGFPAYVRRCIDMIALMSHRRAVCRGNLVFCATHRNLSVHRPNTHHSDSLHTSDGALICLHS